MIAHIAGVPIEEMVGSFGPVLLIVFGAAVAKLRALPETAPKKPRECTPPPPT
jgi:hypothetical protein